MFNVTTFTKRNSCIIEMLPITLLPLNYIFVLLMLLAKRYYFLHDSLGIDLLYLFLLTSVVLSRSYPVALCNDTYRCYNGDGTWSDNSHVFSFYTQFLHQYIKASQVNTVTLGQLPQWRKWIFITCVHRCGDWNATCQANRTRTLGISSNFGCGKQWQVRELLREGKKTHERGERESCC